MYRFARGTIFSARTFLPSASGTQPVSSNISEASSISSAIFCLVGSSRHGRLMLTALERGRLSGRPRADRCCGLGVLFQPNRGCWRPVGPIAVQEVVAPADDTATVNDAHSDLTARDRRFSDL